MFPKVRIRILNASFNMQTILSVPVFGTYLLQKYTDFVTQASVLLVNLYVFLILGKK